MIEDHLPDAMRREPREIDQTLVVPTHATNVIDADVIAAGQIPDPDGRLAAVTKRLVDDLAAARGLFPPDQVTETTIAPHSWSPSRPFRTDGLPRDA